MRKLVGERLSNTALETITHTIHARRRRSNANSRTFNSKQSRLRNGQMNEQTGSRQTEWQACRHEL